jgi:hypothetical protein
MGNEKWMAVHLFLLTFYLVAFLCAAIANTASAWSTWAVSIGLIDILMAMIMDQCNSPQYTVWANRKFVGKNTG